VLLAAGEIDRFKGIATPFSVRKIRTRREFGDAAEW
jgi:hypothetical protein